MIINDSRGREKKGEQEERTAKWGGSQVRKKKGEEKQEAGKDRTMKGWKKVNEEVSKIQVRERGRQRVKKGEKWKG